MIDISFDFRTDSSGGDPDTKSPTLKAYHKELWSKSLPNGKTIDLRDDDHGKYLTFNMDGVKRELSSDTIFNSYGGVKAMSHILEKLNPDEIEDFRRRGYTIGGTIIFPANRVGRKMTLNGARGFNREIRDRFDLTLECIRRFYVNELSPLADVLGRYADFFRMFESFDLYVEFFHLQDLTLNGKVKFFTDLENPFGVDAYPRNLDEYQGYKKRTLEFIEARNQRISNWCFSK